MVDSTRLGDVVDQRAARASELVVAGDAGGEAEEALQDAVFEALDGAGAVAFEGEEVFAGTPTSRTRSTSFDRSITESETAGKPANSTPLPSTGSVCALIERRQLNTAAGQGCPTAGAPLPV
jgi:hypothetical protein